MLDFSYDLEYVSPVTAVFAHPLLKNIKNDSKILTENDNLKQSLDINPIENFKQDFLDPLTSSIVSISLNSAPMHKENSLTSSTSIIDELTGKILSNTLEAEADDQLLDLDPDLVGFRPWREFRNNILESFKTKDRLSLESSFLEHYEFHLTEKKR